MKTLLKVLGVLAALFVLSVTLFHDRKSASEARERNRIEIFYMYNEGESQSDWFRQAAERFRKIHPEAEIDILFAGREVLAKLRPRILVGNPPDIVNQGGDSIRTLAKDGLCERLDEAFAQPAHGQAVPWRDTFIPGLLDVYRIEGHDYMVPAGLFATVFFYNVEQFERLGLTPPETWPEFMAVCEKLKANGIAPIAADGTEAGYNIMWYGGLVGRTSNIAHIKATAKNEPGTSWQEKPFVDAARLVKELVDKGYIMEGYAGSKWPSAQMLWVQGKCGLLLCGTWIPKEMKNKLPDGFRMGIFRFPRVEGYPDGSPLTQDINSEVFTVLKGSRRRELAIEFLRYISSQDEAKYLADMDVPCGTKGVPMPESLAKLDEFFAPPYQLVETTSGITDDLSDWFRNVARNEWSDLFLGRVEPEEMCRRMDESQKRFYERARFLKKPEAE